MAVWTNSAVSKKPAGFFWRFVNPVWKGAVCFVSSLVFCTSCDANAQVSLSHSLSQPLSSTHGGRNLDGSAGVLRLRRELRDSLPYEAQMMSYPPGAGMEGQGNELLYQPDGWRGQSLGQALQRLVEDDRRQDQEAAYLAGLLRLLSESEGNAQRAGKGGEEEDEEGGDLQGPYPPDYDETEPSMSMTKPQASWQGPLDPQLTQALLNRYRQERLLQAGLTPSGNKLQESRGEAGMEEREEEALRYRDTFLWGPLYSNTSTVRTTCSAFWLLNQEVSLYQIV